MSARNYVEGDFGHAPSKQLTTEHHVLLALGFTVPLVLGFWGTTQWFAAKFEYAPALGTPSSGDKLYAPWRILGWLYTLSAEPLPELGTAKAFLAITIGLACLALVLTLATCLKDLRNRSDEIHDSGRWGREAELEAQDLLCDGYPKDGIVLGTYKPDLDAPTTKGNRSRCVVDNSDTPVAVVGPPGSHKNTVCGFPTCFAWRGSALIIDPKLESYKKSAGYRATVLKQRVGILNFIYAPGSLRYNFLDFVRLGTDFEIRDAMNTAIYLTDSSGKGLDDARMEHWVQTPAALLSAGILHVMYRAKQENWGRPATLFDVAWELSGRGHPAVQAAIDRIVAMLVEAKKPVPEDPSVLVDTTTEVLRSWLQYEHAPTEAWEIPGGTTRTHPWVAMRAQDQLDRMKNPEGSAHLSTTRKVLALFEDPHIRRVTSRSDFAVEDLQALEVPSPDGPKQGITLYFPVPLADFKRFRPIYRAFICQATSRLTEEQQDAPDRKRLLYFLDEFPVLGRLDILFNIFGVGRGYGIKPVILFQTFAQLEEAWGEAAARALIDNAETLLAMAPAPGATTTAAKLSEMTGRITLTAENRSRSSRAGGATTNSDSEREVVRPLLTKGEIMTLPRTTHKRDKAGRDVRRPDGTIVIDQAGVQLLYRKNIPVVRLCQTPYYSDPVYLKRSRMAPPQEVPSQRPKPSHNDKGLSPTPHQDQKEICAAQFTAPRAPYGGWLLPPDDAFDANIAPACEDAEQLVALLQEALEVHAVDATLGTASCGPRLITIPIRSDSLEPEQLRRHTIELELASVVGRPIDVFATPAPHFAVQRHEPATIRIGSLRSQVGTPRSLTLGVDALGNAVATDLHEGPLVIRGDAMAALEAWIALLVASYTPDELALDLLIEGLDVDAPHATYWSSASYERALLGAQPSARNRVVITDQLQRRTPREDATVTILWESEDAPQTEGAVTVFFDPALPNGDAWLSRQGHAPTRLHAPLLSARERAALAQHWRRAAAIPEPPPSPPPAISSGGEVDQEALLLELAGFDEV